MRLAILLVVLIALLARGAGAAPITLEYKYKVGDVDTYKVTMTMSNYVNTPGMSGGSASSVDTVTMIVQRKVLEILSDGSATVRQEISEIHGSADIAKDAVNLKPVTSVMIVDTHGDVSKVEGASKSLPFGLFERMGRLPVLPTRSVDVGDSWQTPVRAGGTNVDSKIVSVSETGVKIAQTVKSHRDMGKDGTEDRSESADALFSPQLGKVIELNAKEKTTTNIPMPGALAGQADQPTTQKVIDTTLKMERVK